MLEQNLEHKPLYFDSSKSNLRSLVRSSGDSSLDGWAAAAGLSSPFSLPSADPTSVGVLSAIEAFSSSTAGVLVPEGSSGSSSRTKASAGSRTLPGASFSFCLGLRGGRAGEPFRSDCEVDLTEAVRDTGAAALCRACSSAIRVSIAPLIRFGTGQFWRGRGYLGG